MTPAYAVIGLFVVTLVLLPAAVLAMWLAGTWLVGRDARHRGAVVEEDFATLAALDTSGFATAAQIAALSPRERLFVTRAVSGRVEGVAAAAPRVATPARPAAPVARAPLADREVPIGSFVLVCPACGASLGTAADVAHYVGSCPSCSRRVTSRRRGSRIAFE